MKLEGEIQEIDLVARLIDLWRERFTGALRFENDGVIKIVYYKEGDILSASTNDRADSVDEILMRAGKVTKEHVKQALSKRKENETLGDALLNLGFITRKELTWARRIQVINVIRSIEQWGGGSFTIVSDYLPKREEGTIFPLPQLIVEMVVTDPDRGKFERLLESGAAVFEKAPGHEETFRKLGLNEDAEAVIAHVDGSRPATEVAAVSRQETFNAFKLLHALSLLGILQRRGAGAARASAGFEGVGVEDAADLWGAGEGSQFALEDEPAGSFSASDDYEPPPPVTETPMTSAPATPAWDEAPLIPPPIAAPMSEPPVRAADEEPRWGFDEAQIETAKAAQADATLSATAAARRTPSGKTATSRQAPRKRSRAGWPVALLALLIIGAGAYFAYGWWSSREPAPVAQTVAPPAVVEQPAEAPQPTVVEPTETTSTSAGSPTPTQTTTTAPPALATTTTPPAVVPTTPAKRPAGTDRERFDEMAQAYAANPTGNFTVQFAIVCEPSNVAKALDSSGRDQVWFMPIRLKERSCYRMFWGRFATRAEAERALPGLPGELRESRAAVVTVPR